ncbi:putative Iron-sulfur cluster assembly 2-like protein, mitochondrial [Hypsibius exemplaris]|uniref:Iron-sulfur cluster assembly 2 homolog, mitochondrial n=1 Tax=Hypsibius exemplaris TaxID=2072580 RepID=A0A1W0WAL6_HYPEX|nr:putative Iron-sulfur cluster assembly 2-like protein, mitochondrial [Hypsibius exemplaris]
MRTGFLFIRWSLPVYRRTPSRQLTFSPVLSPTVGVHTTSFRSFTPCGDFVQRHLQHLSAFLPQSRTASSSATQSVDFSDRQSDEAVVLLSDSCVTRLKKLQEESPESPVILRVAVEGGGCSGFQYNFTLDHKVNPDDRIFERNGAKVVIDETSLDYVKGSTVDFSHELIRSAFRVVSNPKAEHVVSSEGGLNVSRRNSGRFFSLPAPFIHSQSGWDTAMSAPPSYDDLFGGPPETSSTARGSSPRPSSRNSANSPRNFLPHDSLPNANINSHSGLCQNNYRLSSGGDDGERLLPGGRRRASERGASSSSSRIVDAMTAGLDRGRSLRESRLDPSAPLQDAMSGLRVSGGSAGRNSSATTTSSSGDRRLSDSYPEPSTNTPNWQQREEENEMRSWFTAVDENDDGFITKPELQQALLNDNWSTFSMDTIDMILKMFDKDFNNRIDFDEFSKIKTYVTQWKTVFDRYDTDRSGSIDVREIRQAFAGMGHAVSLEFCEKLCRRFCQKTPGKMNLDAFIYVCATVSSMYRDYRRSSRNRSFEDVLLK